MLLPLPAAEVQGAEEKVGAVVLPANAVATGGRRGDTATMDGLRQMTDGRVVVRRPEPGDAAVLVAGRDAEFHRWLGDGAPDPEPTGCIVVGGEVVGWVDYDVDRDWLRSGEVNLGYNVFPSHRGHGYASRAVHLLLHHLALRTEHHTATLLIDPGNTSSLALARRTGFEPRGDLRDQRYLTRPVPPVTYSDGVVTIRCQRPEDLDAHLAAIDDVQIDWLWLPGQREAWEAMAPVQQRAHARRVLRANHEAFGMGPKWTFAVDAGGAEYVAHVDCDLANEHVSHGEANVSYSSHPGHRGRGFVTRAIRLLVEFLHDHTGAREAHIIVDARNVASLRVPRSLGAIERERWVDDHGRTLIRHAVPIPRP